MRAELGLAYARDSVWDQKFMLEAGKEQKQG